MKALKVHQFFGHEYRLCRALLYIRLLFRHPHDNVSTLEVVELMMFIFFPLITAGTTPLLFPSLKAGILDTIEAIWGAKNTD